MIVYLLLLLLLLLLVHTCITIVLACSTVWCYLCYNNCSITTVVSELIVALLLLLLLFTLCSSSKRCINITNTCHSGLHLCTQCLICRQLLYCRYIVCVDRYMNACNRVSAVIYNYMSNEMCVQGHTLQNSDHTFLISKATDVFILAVAQLLVVHLGFTSTARTNNTAQPRMCSSECTYKWLLLRSSVFGS
jgi:hypothetical protein